MKKPETYTVRPQDIKKGWYLIVGEWHSSAPMGIRERPVGIPLKVLWVALPLVVVQYLPDLTMRGVMDTRQCRFMRVPLSYVRTLVPAYKKKKDKSRKDKYLDAIMEAQFRSTQHDDFIEAPSGRIDI